ncbi:MAG: phosphoribosyltransferase family protein [bacterium]
MNETIEILTKVGAVLSNGHFVGTSGLHMDTYVNKDFLYPHTAETSRICRLMAEKYKDVNIEVVVGPALGGIILSQWTASHLSEIYGKEVLGIYTEKSLDGGQMFTRGYEKYIKDGKRVLVVEDIITTGGSILKSIKAVQESGGNVVGACAMVNKNKDLDKGMFGVLFITLADLFVDTYEGGNCPFCKNNVPINTNVGHGKKYLESLK